ncbi:MAG: Nif3-like dinuclear metal center hexameric protein, partial [Clostridia bacterium]|nr:Nif3-like dinuclear metal center hexameric protein [Clostridia bacterium]
MTVKELYKFLDSRIPSALSCEWDNDGLMCCTEPNRAVKKVLVALDITDDVIDRAIEGGYDVIVSHHPLIFHPIKNITAGESVPNRLIKLVKSGISAMSFHTRLDSLDGGVNDELAKCLGLNNIKPF